ncbi:MAG: hypothetical protein OSJ63_06565 [Bacilli bacterium]|nr:hypothetical protein [Bacilli bacterium]
MKKIYQRLFNITYNNKIFTIFLADNNRKTFLELKDNNFIYPTYEDFFYLNNFYNNDNLYIDRSPSFFSFKEGVRYKAGFLSIVLSAGLLFPLAGCKARVNLDNNELVIESKAEENNTELNNQSANKKTTVYIENISELDAILGYTTISKEEVIAAIKQNYSMPDEVKILALEVLEEITSEVPDIDLRIFYENMRALNYNVVSLEELQRKYGRVDGIFSSESKAIWTHPGATKRVIKHELYHAIYSFYTKKDGVKYYRYAKLGHFIVEAITENNVSDENTGTYLEARAFLKFLQNYVPLDKSTYYKTSINNYKNKLQAKFPSVNINYLFTLIDTRLDSLIDNKISVERVPTEILDELFSICKLSLENAQNIYDPFLNFAELLNNNEDILFSYFEQYNLYLKEQGYTDLIDSTVLINEYHKFSDIYQFLVTENNPPIPYNSLTISYGSTNYILRYTSKTATGENFESSITTRQYYTRSFNHIKLLKAMIKYPTIIGTPEFWTKIDEDNQIVSPHLYQSIPIYYNEDFIAADYLYDLMVVVGTDSTGKIVLQLVKNNEIIYGPNCELQDKDGIYLDDYLKDEEWIEKINLATILNIKYLSKQHHQFSNLSITSNGLEVKPVYYINLKDGNSLYRASIHDCSFYSTIAYESGNQEAYCFKFDQKYFPITLNSDYSHNEIKLESVLAYYNILDINSREYTFTLSEIEELINSYINDFENKVTR